METVNSTSDARTVNNVMRHEYRVLSEAEKAAMQAIKDKGLELWNLIMRLDADHPVPGTVSFEAQQAAARTEEAVMWAVKRITR